ncbi:hypothetical protein K8P10_000724 [Leucobacter sp. Psy1]|nr:hypothetical protein K8P10_000724 [Leucobacter sp. Psy1]
MDVDAGAEAPRVWPAKVTGITPVGPAPRRIGCDHSLTHENASHSSISQPIRLIKHNLTTHTVESNPSRHFYVLVCDTEYALDSHITLDH